MDALDEMKDFSEEKMSLTEVETLTPSDEKEKPRDTWEGKFDVIVACCGFGIGLGNVWKFPFLCYKNGGGAFLIPYFICCLIGGVPVFFLELTLGQFMAKGGMGTWDLCPLFQGIGLASAIVLFLVNCDYIVIMSWAFYYLFSSLTSVLPWSSCDNEWNTDICRVKDDVGNQSAFTNVTRNQINGSMYSNTSYTNMSHVMTSLITSHPENYTSDPIIEFWERKVLGITDGIEDSGVLKWDLCLCLLLSWVLVYVIICRGIRSSGKIMYFTVTAPYLFMIMLLIRGLTLDGAVDGIKYYLLPDFEKLKHVQVWADAGNQVFYSYAVGLGVLTAIGSYNKFNRNSYRDCILFSCMNSFTSLLSGFVIFTVLGFMAKKQGVSIEDVAASGFVIFTALGFVAKKQGVSIEDVAASGPGLAFIVYPEAVSQLPLAPMWSVFFFCMVIFLGIDSQFVQVEGFVTLFFDLYPRFFNVKYRKQIFTGMTCFVSLLIGLSMVTQGGMYVFQLIDYYSVNKTMLIIALAEMLVVSYAYGINRYMANLEMMYGHKVFVGVKICWAVISPLFILCLLIFGMLFYSELTYDRKSHVYNYPAWAIGIGWILTASSILCIPLVAIYKVLTAKGETVKAKFQHALTPILKKHQLGLEMYEG